MSIEEYVEDGYHFGADSISLGSTKFDSHDVPRYRVIPSILSNLECGKGIESKRYNDQNYYGCGIRRGRGNTDCTGFGYGISGTNDPTIVSFNGKATYMLTCDACRAGGFDLNYGGYLVAIYKVVSDTDAIGKVILRDLSTKNVILKKDFENKRYLIRAIKKKIE